MANKGGIQGLMYFVVTDSGDQFGPHDIPTLKVWVLEGKVLPETPLKAVNSEVMIKAGDMPELFPSQSSTGQALYIPYKSPLPYQRGMPGQVTEEALQRGLAQGKRDSGQVPPIVWLGWAIVVAGLISTFLTPFAFVLFAAVGIYFGWRAKSDNHKSAETLVIVAAGLVPVGLVIVFLLEYARVS